MRTVLLRFNGTVERDPAIDAWMKDHSGELGAIAQEWFEVMRECGDVTGVQELLKRACAVMQSVRLHNVTFTPDNFPNPVLRGTVLQIEYDVENQSDFPVTIWLGACLKQEGEPAQYAFSPAQDTTCEIPSNTRPTVSRGLTVTASQGRYLLMAELWFGAKSVPDRSLLLARKHPVKDVAVIA